MASEAPVRAAGDARGRAPRAGASAARGGDRLRAPAARVHPYRPRAAEHTVLHRVVRAHLATFLRAAEAAGGVPPFVEREFRQFLGCGVWARGFARFRCDTCHSERLVPFSCKARAVCPSCGGRRMKHAS
ncbi:MAG: transposase zinc-binding domain-containing protein [Deltaproteobacteria bacterium]|nr:transposase zinc-binding domain-containing protein [Deltaproteobacteria bacterium]